LREERRRNYMLVGGRSDVLTAIIGARRAWTVSGIEADHGEESTTHREHEKPRLAGLLLMGAAGFEPATSRV
jgi:hypothetical protein